MWASKRRRAVGVAGRERRPRATDGARRASRPLAMARSRLGPRSHDHEGQHARPGAHPDAILVDGQTAGQSRVAARDGQDAARAGRLVAGGLRGHPAPDSREGLDRAADGIRPRVPAPRPPFVIGDRHLQPSPSPAVALQEPVRGLRPPRPGFVGLEAAVQPAVILRRGPPSPALAATRAPLLPQLGRAA